MRITCTHCGPRDHSEFAYGGDAARAYPGLDCTDTATWHDYVFLRDNPRGRHAEYWHHVHGCRRWLRVERDTVTHEIFSVEDAATAKASDVADE
jgi:sarcosine oxidase subunit delta